MRTHLASIALAAVVLASLTACNPFTDPYEDQQRDGGVTPAAAEKQLLAIEGISGAEYGTYDWYSPGEGGMFSSSGMDVVLTVTVDPEYSVADADAFFDYLAATAWSVNDHYPKGDVVIQLIGGADLNYDWLSVAQTLFPDLRDFSTPSSADYELEDAEWYRGGRVLAAGAQLYGEHFGRWPSEPVDAPDGLLAHEPVETMLLPAIIDLSLTATVNGDGEACYSLSFTRNGQGATYYGSVTVSFLDASGTELETDVVSNGNTVARMCTDDGIDPDVAAQVVSGEYDEHPFEPVTEKVELTVD